jgi:hypothetical protein
LQEKKLRVKSEFENYENTENFIENQIKIQNSYIKSIEFT